MSTPRNLLLRVSFDVDQNSDQLVWNIFESVPGDPSAFKRTGVHAGALHFEKDDQLSVEVIAYGRPVTFDNFTITDATLITLPQSYYARASAPSPFDSTHATFDLDNFSPSTCAVREVDLRACTARCATTLTVNEEIGVWKFSMVLTTVITKKKLTGETYQETRVFAFDPIIEVGPVVLH